MLEFVIFTNGALIMILEMVGARVMAPHLGTSVIVWTSLIGIVLACLALGAYLGGRFADKKLSCCILARILLMAGLGCVFTALGHRMVGAFVTENISNIYLAAVVASLALFALPSIFFGMVSPYIIRLRLADIKTSGTTIGRLYALSTAGSIIGTFLGGFVLISFFSSTYILLGTAVALVLLSLIVYTDSKKLNIARVLLLLFISFSGFVNSYYNQFLTENGAPPPFETLYNNIRIFEGYTQEKDHLRFMATDPLFSQSAMYVNEPTKLYFPYTQFYAMMVKLFSENQKILMLGGGGYSLPKWLLSEHHKYSDSSLHLDVVELDSGMTDLAKSYFALKEDARMRIFHEDARRYINANNNKYDLVFVDVFNSYYSIPFHMATKEAVMKLRHAVRDDGALVMNIISAYKGDNSAILQGIYGALSQAFPKLYVFAISENTPLTEVQNFMILALTEENQHIESIIENSKQNSYLSPGEIKMLGMRVTEEISQDIPPLSDEFSPIERYAQILLK